LRTRFVVGKVIRPTGSVQRGDHPANDIVDMHPAEHLFGQVDAVRVPGHDPVERRPAGPVDARQPEHACAELQPCRIRRRPRAAPPANRGTLVHPGTRGVAIDSGRGQIADPARCATQRIAIGDQDRIRLVDRRHGRQDMRRTRQSALDICPVVESYRPVPAVAARTGDVPSAPGKRIRDMPRRIAQPEDQQSTHSGVPPAHRAP